MPDLPDGESLACLEKEKSCIQSEMKKSSPDWVLVAEAMDSTFSLRREIIEDEPLVEELKKTMVCTAHSKTSKYSPLMVLVILFYLLAKN